MANTKICLRATVILMFASLSYFTKMRCELTKKSSPGEARTPDLRMSDTVYKYDALTDCATGEISFR